MGPGVHHPLRCCRLRCYAKGSPSTGWTLDDMKCIFLYFERVFSPFGPTGALEVAFLNKVVFTGFKIMMMTMMMIIIDVIMTMTMMMMMMVVLLFMTMIMIHADDDDINNMVYC